MAKKSGKSEITSSQREEAEAQIRRIQREIRYDTRDFPIQTIVERFQRGNFYIPPYQREFVWSKHDQSLFIESVLIGLPIPMMFIADADTDEGAFEIVDGVQRISTLDAFSSNFLCLSRLGKLTSIEGFRFSDLSRSQQNKFLSRALRIVVLDAETSDENRRELFNRINKSGRPLKPSERRIGSMTGKFMDFLFECSNNEELHQLCPVSQGLMRRKEHLELVTRFFAYSDRYLEFKHDVDDFLDTYVKDKLSSFDEQIMKSEFTRMLSFVRKYFRSGFAKSQHFKTTPRVRFEAIAVGVNLALRINPSLIPDSPEKWIVSRRFEKETTTHASNSRPRLKSRVEYVRDKLLGKELGDEK